MHGNEMYIKAKIVSVRYQYPELEKKPSPRKGNKIFKVAVYTEHPSGIDLEYNSNDAFSMNFIGADIAIDADIYISGVLIDPASDGGTDPKNPHLRRFLHDGYRNLFLTQNEADALLTKEEAQMAALRDKVVHEKKWTVGDLLEVMAQNEYNLITDAANYNPAEMTPEIMKLRDTLEQMSRHTHAALSEEISSMAVTGPSM